jgi:environmental stress-induced protein Ves
MRRTLAHVAHLADVVATPWKNGGGTTRELLVWPKSNDDVWSIRVSVAEIASSGVFSAYPGIDRCFAVIDGTGVRLSEGLGCVERGSAPIRFDGALAPKCQLIDGPTVDLNVMIHRSRGHGSLRVLHDCAREDTEYLIDINDTTVAGAFCAVACDIVDDGELIRVPPMSLIWTDCELPSRVPIRLRTNSPDRVWCFTFLESLRV